ncbi:hypothetical protein [Streptomyces sp. NRRL F-5135]|uniref:hypothetical protein n=1 Tax=Streptomyces sp. NRRL F-5135 TaxID=1463858 RepID=UPI0004CB3F5A|nr:hypothetical protein [Streptomyces sp. NRRL F-5135]
MQFTRSWGIGLVTAAVLIGGGATIANAASGASSHDGGDQPAVVLPEGDRPGTPAGDETYPLPEGDRPGTPAGDSQAYPLPEGDRPGTPAGDETYRP